MSGREKLKEKREVRGMEGRQELFTEGKRKGRVGEKKENVRGKTREMGGEILGRGVNKAQRERGRL